MIITLKLVEHFKKLFNSCIYNTFNLGGMELEWESQKVVHMLWLTLTPLDILYF